jgi:hypothetical protein
MVGWKAVELQFDSWQGYEIFLFPITSTPPLENTQVPME